MSDDTKNIITELFHTLNGDDKLKRIISLAKNGVLIRRLDRQNLFNLLMEEILPPETEKKTKKQPFWRKKHEKV